MTRTYMILTYTRIDDRVFATIDDRVFATIDDRVFATIDDRVFATIDDRVFATTMPFSLSRRRKKCYNITLHY